MVGQLRRLWNPAFLVTLVGGAASGIIVVAIRQTEYLGLREGFRAAADNRIRAVRRSAEAEISWLVPLAQLASESPQRFLSRACSFESAWQDLAAVGFLGRTEPATDTLRLYDCNRREPIAIPAATGWKATYQQALQATDPVLSPAFRLPHRLGSKNIMLAARRVEMGKEVAGVVWLLIDTQELLERAVTMLSSYGVHVGLIEGEPRSPVEWLAFHRSRRETRDFNPPTDLRRFPGAADVVTGELFLGQRRMQVLCLPAGKVLAPSTMSGLPAGLSLLFATGLLAAFVAAQRRRAQEVEAIVQVRTRELAAARDEAVRAMRLKSQFLANMSHEIRTPMNGVLGLADLLADTELAPHQQALLENLRGSARSLLRIVNDILNLARIEAGRLELVEESFDLVHLFDSLLQSFAATVAQKRIELFSVIRDSAQIRVHGDLGRLGQILSNLVGNAMKFTDTGSVEVTAWAEPVAAAAGGPSRVRLHVQVKDTGPGIPRDQLPLLFQPFTQLESGYAKRHAGTGLGLTIARELVERMGGQIGVDSEPGTGSTFWFHVILGQESAGHAEPVGPLEGLRGQRALLVGRSATLERSVAYYLAAWEMLPEIVPDWITAADQLLSSPPAARRLVVADLGDPAVESTLSWAEQLPGTALNLVLITPPGRPHQLSLPSGTAAHWLTRPFGLRDLQAAVSRGCQPSGAEVAAPPEPAPATGSRGRVLLVEDHPINQKVAAGLLNKLRFEFQIASSGQEALITLSRQSFDAILMDCQMPGMDGFEATRLIRAVEEETGRRTPIIALTANTMPGDRDACLEAGMDDYLPKPIRVAELEAVLERWVSPRQCRSAPMLTS